MKLTEEQLQEWELAASQRQYQFCIDLADLFVQAVPALIADLREARVELAESKSAYQPDSDHQSRYYVEQQGFWFWVVKCGTGTRTIFRSRTQIGAIEMARELQTAFLDGEFIGQKAKLAEAEKDATKWRKYADEIRLGMDPRYVRVVVECVREDGLIYRNGELLLKSDAKSIGRHVGEKLAEAVMETAIAAQGKP